MKAKKVRKAMILIALIGTMLAPNVEVYGELISNTVYRLNNPHNIQLTNVSLELQNLSEFKDFDDSMKDLDEILDGGETGATTTQIYVDSEKNPNDAVENTVKVDVDFAGHTTPAPANVVFLMDQSGSMNMSANLKNSSKYTSPCMNPNHYYRIRIGINGEDYVFYYNPTEAKLIDSWTNANTDIRNHIGEKAVEQGLAISSSQVTIKNISYNGNDAPERNHYRIQGESETINEENRFFKNPSDTTTQTIDEEEFFSKIELGWLEDETYTSVREERFYSPAQWYNTPGAPTTPDWREIGSDAYFSYLDENSLCYDRMTVSKILFEELSNYAISENTDNRIGFAKYSGIARGSRELEYDSFEGTSFDELTGYAGTNWGVGYDSAIDMFNEDYRGQNIVIMVTDGRPSVAPNKAETVKQEVDKIALDYDALMFFVGVSLEESAMTTFKEAASTETTSGESLAYNGKTLDDFKGIIGNLEEILTSTTQMETQLGEIMTIRIGEDHPITVQFRYTENEIEHEEILTFNNLEAAEEIGLIYDEETNTLSWDMHRVGITNVRLSYYQKIDEEKIDWPLIEEGGSIDGFTNRGTNVDYIDRTGQPSELTGEETASYSLKNASRLTIENQSPTPTEVQVGENIEYNITVTNTGVLQADNLVVRQKIPENTEFSSSDKAIYDESANQLIYEIPTLLPGESTSFTYFATATEYNSIIESSAQLGVSTQSHTLDNNGNPILSAEIIEHKTPSKEIIGRPTTGDDFALIALIAVMVTALLGTIIMIGRRNFKKDK